MPLLRAWKEHGLRRLAPLAAELAVARLERPPVDVITYIPADPVRQLTRAHHPAQAFAHELARLWQLDCEQLLERTRHVERQAELPLARRAGNVRGAFASRRTTGGRVALVDDIYTSGSTANAAARALRSAGADRVEVVTFARALRSDTLL